MIHRPSVRIACAVAATAMTGCASVPDIAERHHDGNVVQERVVNQQLLLNIVRAAHRQPLHFSTIPYVRLPLVNSAPWTLTVPFGVVGPYGRNSLATSLGAQVITVEVTPQTSQEFMQGITTPVRPALMDLYLQQGWPQQTVLYLFVEEMRLIEKKPGDEDGRAIERYRNDPANATEMKKFVAAVRRMTAHCDLRVGSNPPQPGPLLPAPMTIGLVGLPDAVNAGLVGARTAADGKVALGLQLPGSAKVGLVPKTLDNGSSQASECLPEQGIQTDRGKVTSGLRDQPGIDRLFQVWRNAGARTAPPTKGGSGDETWIELTFRSPDGMVYYLGELIRDGAAPVDVVGSSGVEATLFKVDAAPVQTGAASADAAVAVDFWNWRYSIARAAGRPSSQGPADRSMQTLALVSQILQLQNKATASPRSTPPLRVEPAS